MKIKTSELKSLISECLRNSLKETRLFEKAPPGDEDKVMELKKSLRKQHPDWDEKKVVSVAMATAWKQHNEKKTEESVSEGTPPPVPPVAHMVSSKPADLSQTAFGKTSKEVDTAKDAYMKNPSDQKAKQAYSAALQKLAQVALMETPEKKEEEMTKVTISELRTMIRNGLKEAFGIGGKDGPTGGFDKKTPEGKKKESGTFGDGKEVKDKLPESASVVVSMKEIKEQINKIVNEMLQLKGKRAEESVEENMEEESFEAYEEGYEAPTMREESVPMEMEEECVMMKEGDLWGYKLVNTKTGNNILIKEEYDYPKLAKSLGWEGQTLSEAKAFLDANLNETFVDPGYFTNLNEKKGKPSAGLTKKQKSAVVKKAKAGKDIGKKGKGFKEVEKKAKEAGAKDPKAVAGAVLWKNLPRKKE